MFIIILHFVKCQQLPNYSVIAAYFVYDSLISKLPGEQEK